MITIVLMMHTLTWMNFQSLEYLYPGESTYICDAKFSQPGPKDSIIRAWCEYEPWMERWIDPGEGPDVETVVEHQRVRPDHFQ